MVHRRSEGVFEPMPVWKLDRDWRPLGFLASCEQFLHGGYGFGYQRSIPDVQFETVEPVFEPEPHLSQPLLPIRFGRVRIG